MSNIKRRHHYVWKHYLKPWTTNGTIYCLRENEPFPTNLDKIGVKKDFYKLRELSASDLDFIKKLAIDRVPDHLKTLHKDLLESFNKVFEIKKIIENQNIDAPNANHQLKLIIHNMEEELHSSIEKMGDKYLQLLYEEDINFWENENDVINFTYFIVVQYMRTKSRKENLLYQLQGEFLEKFEKTWNVLSHIFATNIAWSLYKDRASLSLILLKNNTTVNFITGDQPCINIAADPDPTSDPPERLTLYYPVSPRLGVLLKDQPYAPEKINLNPDRVVEYNSLIASHSYEQLYALTGNDLKPFQFSGHFAR